MYRNGRDKLLRGAQAVRPVADNNPDKLPESKAATVSQVIAATTDAGMIKPDEKVGASRKFARYLPFWA